MSKRKINWKNEVFICFVQITTLMLFLFAVDGDFEAHGIWGGILAIFSLGIFMIAERRSKLGPTIA